MSSSSPDLEHLSLVALDAEDLAVMSANLQDALVKIGDLAYLPDEHRFAFVARRFDWQSPGSEPRRRLTGIHFDRVLQCRSRGFDRGRGDDALNLLAITFEPSEPPSGTATLLFAGSGTIELELECVEARLKDLGPVWAAGSRPDHDAESS